MPAFCRCRSTRHRSMFACFAVVLIIVAYTTEGASSIQAQPMLGSGSPERLRAGGLEGSVLLVRAAVPDSKTIDRFLEAAGKDKANVVLVAIGNVKATAVQELFTSRKLASLQILLLADRAAANQPEKLKPLATASGVWLLGDGPAARLVEIVEGSGFARELEAIQKRNGVVAASGDAVPLLVARSLEKVNGKTVTGLNRLPGMLMLCQPDPHLRWFPQVCEQHPGYVGVQLHEDASLMVRGREVRAHGASVQFCLAKTSTRPARTIELKADERADFNELIRCAIARA